MSLIDIPNNCEGGCLMIHKNKTNYSRLLAWFRNMWYTFELEKEYKYDFPINIDCWNIVEQRI